MINKKITYNCSVEEKGFSNFYEIKPNITLFRSGKLWYYLDEKEKIRYVENEGISVFNSEDINIEEISGFTKLQYLYLRKIYKLVNCKFSIIVIDKTMTIYNCNSEKLLTINDVSNLFSTFITLSSAYLEKMGVFNDIL